MLERATERIRSAGRYRSVRYRPGDGHRPGMAEDPSVVAIPVGVNGRQYGLLVVETDPCRPPDEAERLLLEECADDLALALHLERLEQVRRENLIRILESEERFRQVFHQTNDAILLYEVARTAGTTAVSRRTSRPAGGSATPRTSSGGTARRT